MELALELQLNTLEEHTRASALWEGHKMEFELQAPLEECTMVSELVVCTMASELEVCTMVSELESQVGTIVSELEVCTMVSELQSTALSLQALELSGSSAGKQLPLESVLKKQACGMDVVC